MIAIDIGTKHLTLTYKPIDQIIFKTAICQLDNQKEDQLNGLIKAFRLKLDEIFSLFDNIVLVIIELQRQQAYTNMCLMYSLCMYCELNGYSYKLQPASQKYTIFKGRDQKQFKQLGEMFIQENYMDKIECVYSNLKQYPKSHRYYNEQLIQFLKEHQIDKFDDIADTILMILYQIGYKTE